MTMTWEESTRVAPHYDCLATHSIPNHFLASLSSYQSQSYSYTYATWTFNSMSFTKHSPPIATCWVEWFFSEIADWQWPYTRINHRIRFYWISKIVNLRSKLTLTPQTNAFPYLYVSLYNFKWKPDSESAEYPWPERDEWRNYLLLKL